MLRVTRKGIRRESLAEYALLPREDGSPAWIPPNSFDAVSPSGFWQAKFTPRIDAKLENGLVSNAMKSGLAFSSSTAGETPTPSFEQDGKPQKFPIPGLLSEEEIKLSYAHAPMMDDVRICWDHSSWRSCPRGASCSFNHSMIPTKNLHWITRAQLAKRGRHRSQVRIAPDAVPGYIAALRETNSAGDGKDTTKHIIIWKAKGNGQDSDHRTGETVIPDLNPSADEIPPDFADIGYTALGTKLDQIAHGTDSWAETTDPAHLIPWRDRSISTPRQTTLGAWRGQSQPRIDAHIEPWAMRYMGKSSESFSLDLLKRGLSDLSSQGSSKQRLLAEEGLKALNSARVGHQGAIQSYWGEVLRRVDFSPQELTIACIHFQVIDFGDSIPIQGALMRSTGDVENVERNQCVLLHLAAGILRNESGRPKRVPDRGRVFTLVQELRRIELPNALLAMESLQDDTSLEGMIVKSNAHDVCHPSHDRDFRTLGFFLSSVLTDRGIGCLRIFDVGRGTNGYDVSVHLFPNSIGDNGSVYIDLIAHRHHMRWGKLVEDTRPEDLIDWERPFSSLVQNPVISWAIFAQNPTETDVIVPTACVYCKEKIKIPVEIPLLQAESKCGGRRRNSIGTEGDTWRVSSANIMVVPPSLSWIPDTGSPMDSCGDLALPPPPSIAPPLINTLEETIVRHRTSTIKRWSRTDDASFPLISFNWRDSLSPALTSCSQDYLNGVNVECSSGNIWAIAELGDRLNKLAGEPRIAARHIQGITLGKRNKLVEKLSEIEHIDPGLVRQVKGYHARGALPVYRGLGPDIPRLRCFPYKPGQSFDIISKIWKDVQAGES